MIWATGEAPEELLELKEEIELQLGVTPEKRKFSLHFTLTRFREEDFRKFPVKKLHEHIDWKENVHSVVLMESRLSRDGADYEVLEEVPLK